MQTIPINVEVLRVLISVDWLFSSALTDPLQSAMKCQFIRTPSSASVGSFTLASLTPTERMCKQKHACSINIKQVGIMKFPLLLGYSAVFLHSRLEDKQNIQLNRIGKIEKISNNKNKNKNRIKCINQKMCQIFPCRTCTIYLHAIVKLRLQQEHAQESDVGGVKNLITLGPACITTCHGFMDHVKCMHSQLLWNDTPRKILFDRLSSFVVDIGVRTVPIGRISATTTTMQRLCAHQANDDFSILTG